MQCQSRPAETLWALGQQSSRGREASRRSAIVLAPPVAAFPETSRATGPLSPPMRASPSASTPPHSPETSRPAPRKLLCRLWTILTVQPQHFNTPPSCSAISFLCSLKCGFSFNQTWRAGKPCSVRPRVNILCHSLPL